MCALTRSMLSRGLALLRIRMICLIWLWLTLLLMQPNTTSALGWRDGLYWNANLESKQIKSCMSTFMFLAHLALKKRIVWAGDGLYFCASSVHWSNHLQAGMSLIQAWENTVQSKYTDRNWQMSGDSLFAIWNKWARWTNKEWNWCPVGLTFSADLHDLQ